MSESDFHHVSRVKACVTEMFSTGNVEHTFIVLRSGATLHGQLRGTTVSTENSSVKLLNSSGKILSVDMREIADIGYGNSN